MPPAPKIEAPLEEILDDPRATTEYRILRATRRLLVTHGLEVSMDDIAAEAQVGRRTLFRYFDTRDELIAAALSLSLSSFNKQVEEIRHSDEIFTLWIRNMVSVLYTSQLHAGRALWQLAATDDNNLSDPIAKVNKKRRQSRRSLTQMMANEAWTRAGGKGSAPRSIELVVSLGVSSFAVHSLHTDYTASSVESIDAIAFMIESCITSELNN